MNLRCLSLHTHTHTSALCKRPATADDAPIETKDLARVNSPSVTGAPVMENHTWSIMAAQPQGSSHHGGWWSSGQWSQQNSPSSSRCHPCSIKLITIFCPSARLSLCPWLWVALNHPFLVPVSGGGDSCKKGSWDSGKPLSALWSEIRTDPMQWAGWPWAKSGLDLSF